MGTILARDVGASEQAYSNSSGEKGLGSAYPYSFS